jgi:hypothetical protein
MSGRYRGIALQAVGVAVLASIIYLAFLRPNDPDPVTGIQGPDALEQAKTDQRKPDGKGDRGNKRARKPGKKANGHSGPAHVSRPGMGPGTGGSDAGRLPGAGVVAGQGPAASEPPGGTHGDSPHTPPGSQYQDSVARIRALLGQ